MIWLFLLTMLVIAGVSAIAYYGMTEIIRIPFLAVPYRPDDFGLAYEEMSFMSHDGLRLTAGFFPPRESSDVTLIILHGLGSNAGDMLLNRCVWLVKGNGISFYVNFRGHGGSEGPYHIAWALGIERFGKRLAFLKAAKPKESRRLGIYGHSLGAAVAIVAAARHPEFEAVVVESPFSRTVQTIGHFSEKFYGIPRFPDYVDSHFFGPCSTGRFSERLCAGGRDPADQPAAALYHSCGTGSAHAVERYSGAFSSGQRAERSRGWCRGPSTANPGWWPKTSLKNDWWISLERHFDDNEND